MVAVTDAALGLAGQMWRWIYGLPVTVRKVTEWVCCYEVYVPVPSDSRFSLRCTSSRIHRPRSLLAPCPSPPILQCQRDFFGSTSPSSRRVRGLSPSRYKGLPSTPGRHEMGAWLCDYILGNDIACTCHLVPSTLMFGYDVMANIAASHI